MTLVVSYFAEPMVLSPRRFVTTVQCSINNTPEISWKTLVTWDFLFLPYLFYIKLEISNCYINHSIVKKIRRNKRECSFCVQLWHQVCTLIISCSLLEINVERGISPLRNPASSASHNNSAADESQGNARMLVNLASKWELPGYLQVTETADLWRPLVAANLPNGYVEKYGLADSGGR